MAVWRVGYIASACEFTPRALCGWNHRFDDPKREYRTVYAADKKETCLREVLADLRPDTKTLRDFEKLFGDDSAVADAGKVTVAWRAKHVLVHADIVLTSGRMTDIEAAATLARLSSSLGQELSARGLKRVDAAAVRSRDRGLTRAASRILYDAGSAGIDFRSRLDGVRCHALFEGRSYLRQCGVVIELRGEVPELATVCAEYGLSLG